VQSHRQEEHLLNIGNQHTEGGKKKPRKGQEGLEPRLPGKRGTEGKKSSSIHVTGKTSDEDIKHTGRQKGKKLQFFRGQGEGGEKKETS